jgi:hypothetical protein
LLSHELLVVLVQIHACQQGDDLREEGRGIRTCQLGEEGRGIRTCQQGDELREGGGAYVHVSRVMN